VVLFNLLLVHFPSDNNDLYDLCFELGTSFIDWHVQDTVGQHTANDHATCGIKIVVSDVSKPFVDCQQCNTDAASAIVCNTDTNTVVGTIAQASLVDYFNDQYIEDNGAVAYAGSEGVACDCTATTHSTPFFYSNTWNSWINGANIFAYDVNDANLVLNYPSAETADNVYNLTYSATDDDSNTGSCNIDVVFDRTPPSCNPFIDLNVSRNESDKNYSVEVAWDTHNVNGQDNLSGLLFGPTFVDTANVTEANAAGHAYLIPYNVTSVTYETEWRLGDKAGNNATCEWKIIVQNPNPCLWPYCDDTPPTVDNGTCPSDITLACGGTADCGCGGWTEPTFSDDKGVLVRELSYNGTLVGDWTNLNYPNQPLSVGKHTFKYEAFDWHNASATCEFTVTITDTVAPVVINCPASEEIPIATNDFLYNYTVNYTDECTLNQVVTYDGGLHPNSALHTGDVEGQDTLQAGQSYSYTWTITDDQDNSVSCNWNITVADVGKPDIYCPDDIIKRIEQTYTSININWAATANDTNDGDISANIVYSPHQPLDPFTSGNYTVHASITDSGNNNATCNFTIEVLPAYPTFTFLPALSKALVTESATGFEAAIEIVTLTNAYHIVDDVTASAPSGTNDNAQFGTNTVSAIAASCGTTDPICEQRWEITAAFTDCTATGKAYDFTSDLTCLDDGVFTCTENIPTQSFTATLTASNYCWQDLAAVDIDAVLITVDETTGDQYATDVDAGSNPANPTAQSAFNNGDTIVGLVIVSSSQVDTSDVSITAVSKSHYWDYTLSNLEESHDLFNTATLLNKASFASFKYTENDIPLETTWYTQYTATVSLSYGFGQRRALLNIDTKRQLEQADPDTLSEQVTAMAVSFNKGTTAVSTTDVNDAVAVMALQGCDSSTTSWENTFANIIAKFLRIDTTRVSTEIDPTNAGYCLMEVTIKQSDCADTVSVIDLLQYLENGVMDTFSELHEYLGMNEDISSDITFDHTVYFVAQTPATIYQEAAVSSNVDTTSSTDSLAWYYYAAAGVVIGLIFVTGVHYAFGNKSQKQTTHSPLTPERRYSIADLLAATERRSSIDVNNVRLHNAL
jgi:hypothetical protein